MEDNKSAMHQGFAGKAGEFLVGNDLRVTRLGFGSMRITGKGIWGEPTDRAGAVRVLRRAVELGINFIDTADSYGPGVSEEILAEALHPYPANLVSAKQFKHTEILVPGELSHECLITFSGKSPQRPRSLSPFLPFRPTIRHPPASFHAS